jgi:hypothetical protein
VKQLLLNLLSSLGLVPAGRYTALVKENEGLRSSALSWKAKAGEATAQVKALESDLHRQSRLVKEARRAAEAGAGDGDMAKLREQLVTTERELILAREHLMAIEVKLDILEGAANVLDSRTRAAIRQSTGTGAAV